MQAIIFTEGQTDWKHIKKAQAKLGIILDIEYWEQDSDRGDDKLYDLCHARATVPNDKVNIFIFDRDNKSIISKVNSEDGSFKEWGNNVFSFSIPIPENRKLKECSLSIEFYYSDKVLYSEDINHKRLFCSSEFDEKSGRHKTLKNISYGNHNKLKGFTLPTASKILDSDVFNEKSENVAMSKNQFAEYIQNDVPPFVDIDFLNFNLIFDLIKKIIVSSTQISQSIMPFNLVNKNRLDHPPNIDFFVGRSELISKLRNPTIRVAAITGFGGEGKSSLAAKIYKLFSSNESNFRNFQRISWADCKDEETPFHEKLLGILEYITDGAHKKTMYAEENIKDTINRFLDILNNINCFVVFDNVDAFVDKDKPIFTGHLKFLFDSITSKLTNSYVLFTCRSSIIDHHFSFIEIPIQGLSFEESMELAKKFNLNINNGYDDIIKNIHYKTNGHALWLNLIFGQLRNNRLSTEQINTLISKQTSALKVHLLNSIWENLNKNEKEILNIVGTFTRPPTLRKIEKVSSLTYQKCSKVINTLLKLRLIIELDKEGETHYDLHPIVRLKIKETLPHTKTNTYAAKILKSLVDWNQLIVIMNLYDESTPKIDDFIECTEIAIENKSYNEALKYLYKLSDPLLKYGEDVKFIELCENVFKGLNFDDLEIKNNREFPAIYSSYITILLNQDEFAKVNLLLESFSKTLSTIKDFIFYSEIMTYSLWFQNRFSDAINFSHDVIKKITEKGESVSNEIYYNQALSNRDYGNVDEALEFFLQKTSLDKIDIWDPLSNDSDDISADVGNISRCYYLKNEYNNSLKYCSKSNKYLEKGKNRHDKVNYGYSLLWLADTYYKLGDFEKTKLNIEEAYNIWVKFCPSRLKKIKKHLANYSPQFTNALSFMSKL